MSKANPIKILPSVEVLRECFSYNRHTGELRWRKRPLRHFIDARVQGIINTRCAGKIAGSISQSTGYREVSVNSILYLVHRVVWKMLYGEEPPASLDHVDGDRKNNCRQNLRPASKAEQAWNASLGKNMKSSHRGVSRNGTKWKAEIRERGIRHHLGTFDSAESASAAYEATAREIHGKFYLPRGERK